MFERDNNIEIQGRGEATAARLTLSIDEGWSVQHFNSGKYALKKVSRCNTSVLEYMLSLRIPISQKPKLERRFSGGWGATPYICSDTADILNLL